MFESTHIARDYITTLVVALQNYYVNAATETGIGAAITVHASAQYSLGTFIQFKWAGGTSGSIPDLSVRASDLLAINTPEGSRFSIRAWYSNATGIPLKVAFLAALASGGCDGAGPLAAGRPIL
jgi:hypothetical protein